MTTLTKVVVRNTDTKTDTNIIVISGGTLDLSKLPAHWTLDFQLSHAADTKFSVDGGPVQEYQAVPYCPLGHDVPLNLPVGSHKIQLTIDNVSVINFPITITQSVATPTMGVVLVDIAVHDIKANADTTTLIADGGVVDMSKFPAEYCLHLTFNTTKFNDVAISLDGGPVTHQMSEPRMFPNKNVALAVRAGLHSLTYTVTGLPARTVNFTAAISPVVVAQPTTELPSAAKGRGTNLRAVTDAFCAPNAKTTAACSLFDFEYIRLWLENKVSYLAAWPDAYWANVRAWKAAGKKVVLQSQFWKVNNVPIVPSDADWVAKWTAMPDAATTGAWGVSLGNECNNRTTYFNGSIQQLAHLMQLSYPILKAKGYVVIAPSFIGSLQPIQDLQALGAYQFCDYIDYHVYEATAVQCLKEVDAFTALAATIGKPPIMTECGIRGSNSNRPAWATETQAYIVGLKTRALTWLYFPFIPLDRAIPAPAGADPLADDDAILDVAYGANEPFYSAIVAGLK